MLVVTGAAGFIGSHVAKKLAATSNLPLVLVDDFTRADRKQNTEGLKHATYIHREQFHEWLSENGHEVKAVFHLGARTDTTEFNFRVLDSLNLSYTKALWEICTVKNIPLIYASSAATYGLGEHGFSDNHALLQQLKPLNPYGLSKHLFDLFAVAQAQSPPHWYGLKFFNVYGPYEYHKGRMASVVYHGYHQIKETGKLKLFRSHHPEFGDGEQKRDFIYVDDIVQMCLFFWERIQQSAAAPNGLYNAGTGIARSFNNLSTALFSALHLPENVEYIDTPADIRDKYQYYTCAEMDKMKDVGYNAAPTTLEEGVKKYVAFLEANAAL